MKRAAPLFVVAICLALVSCGYRVASRNRLPRDMKSLAVRLLENDTTTFQIEQILTRALVGEFVRRTDFQVLSDEAAADAVLSGRVTRVTANPVTFAQSAFASTFLVTIYARVELKSRSGEVLFEGNDYVFREQYIINVDVGNFFSELNPALDRVAEDFAASVVTSVVESL